MPIFRISWRKEISLINKINRSSNMLHVLFVCGPKIMPYSHRPIVDNLLPYLARLSYKKCIILIFLHKQHNVSIKDATEPQNWCLGTLKGYKLIFPSLKYLSIWKFNYLWSHILLKSHFSSEMSIKYIHHIHHHVFGSATVTLQIGIM